MDFIKTENVLLSKVSIKKMNRYTTEIKMFGQRTKDTYPEYIKNYYKSLNFKNAIRIGKSLENTFYKKTYK